MTRNAITYLKHLWRHGFVLVASCLLFCTQAAAEEPRQYKIEAAYLYNFFNYITWPGYGSPEALKRPVICIYDGDPIEPYLFYMQRKTSGERQLDIRVLHRSDPTGECHILFVRNGDGVMPPAVFPGTLTVSDNGNALERGNMIELAHENERIAMDINYSLMEKDGFRVSSRLLNLAQRVQ